MLRLHRLASLLNIQSGEGRLVGLLLALAFCIGFVRLFIQTAAGTLFLSVFDVEALPYVYVGVAIVVPALGVGYGWLEARVSFRRLLLTNVGGLLAGSLALWLGLLSGAKWAVFGLAVWFDVIWAMTGLLGWGLAGRLLDLRQGKRLFGLIGAGDVVAATLGGLLAPFLVDRLGTSSLLIAAVLGLMGALGLVIVITRLFANTLTGSTAGEAHQAHPAVASPQDRRYIGLLLALAMISFASFYFIDNIFYGQVEARYPSEAELAGFLGPFWAVVNAITMLINLFGVSFVTARYGLRVALFILPVSTLFTALALVAGGVFFPAAFTFIFWAAMLNNLLDWIFRETMHKTSLLILYQPLPPARRTQVQTTVESIGQPIAQGLAGLGLLGLGALGAVGLTGILAGMLLVGLVFVFWLSRDYLTMLMQALAKRKLGSDQIVFNDSASIALLRRGLTDTHPGAALYALALLEDIGDPALADDLGQALTHPTPEVRQEALARIERLRLAPTLDAVLERAVRDTVPAVRGLALRALAALDPANALSRLQPYLDDADSLVRFYAIVGLLRQGGPEGTALAEEHVRQLLRSPQDDDLILAARAIGDARPPDFAPAIRQLLTHTNPEVRRAALVAAGALNQPALWPAIVAALSDSAVHSATAQALVVGGEAALPALQGALGAPELSFNVQHRILRVLGRIGGQQAAVMLRGYYWLTPADWLRREALLALRRCGYQASASAETAEVLQALNAEVAETARLLAALVVLSDRETEADMLLHAALQEVVARRRQCLLALLGCLYDPRVIIRVGDSLVQRDKHAYGLEVLDNLLAQDLKPIVLPLLEALSPRQALQQLGPAFAQPAPGRDDCLLNIVAAPAGAYSTWVKNCALFALTRAGSAPMSGNVPEEATTMLFTIERVLILKTVGMFAGTPDSLLAEIAALLEEIELPAGESLFAKNDLAHSMYIIVDGRLRVHDGEVVLNYLGERAIVGEMAVLDSSPRMASVTAETETRLLRLDQDTLYELIGDRPEVARGIIGVLSDHLRARVQTITELNARLQAFENQFHQQP